jgi:hypothetical protein
MSEKNVICLPLVENDYKEMANNTPTNIWYDALLASFKINYIFYIGCLLCILGLSYVSNTSFVKLLATFICISFIGYVAHVGSHMNIAKEMAENFKKKIGYGQKNKGWISWIANQTVEFYDFHDTVHHDVSVNKKWNNIMIEAIGNFWFQAGMVLVLKFILHYMDTSMIIIWGISYATVHNINYILFPSKVHMKHHSNKHTNYGMDIWDILFNTKYEDDLTEIENINHYTINFAICTVIICLWIWWHKKKTISNITV